MRNILRGDTVADEIADAEAANAEAAMGPFDLEGLNGMGTIPFGVSEETD